MYGRALLLLALGSSFACGLDSPRDGGALGRCAPPRLAVLAAFPAELAPLVERARIDNAVEIGERVFREGELGGVPVVLGMTGIGMVNAAATTRMVFERFEVEGVVVSGVAGSRLWIGDVAVPTGWRDVDGTTHDAHPPWLELARAIASAGAVSLDSCTHPPAEPSEAPICLPHEPAIRVGGTGRSRDPFGGEALACQPGGDDVYGCDVGAEPAPAWPAGGGDARDEPRAVDPAAPIVGDMETAAVGREAARRSAAFIAFRAVSDGSGDPLGLPGFPAQFFTYYRLAARNAAAATLAFLEQVAAVGECESPPR